MTTPNDSVMQINQSIHGYSEGHRRLKSSIELVGQDSLTMLILSDSSADVSLLPTKGYLTGYPLKESGLYAFAKTWPAPEIKRPGCVWTHTLLIEYADLAEILDFTQLLTLFRKPEGMSSLSDYASPIAWHNLFEQDIVSNDLDVGLIESALIGLYKNPNKRVRLKTESAHHADITACIIWNQQWPRLRRAFRFCTFMDDDRSTSDHSFDLQFSSLHRESLSENELAEQLYDDVNDVSQSWLATALDDLIHGKTELRPFLRKMGSDFSNGRQYFAELCALFEFFQSTQRHSGAIEKSLSFVFDRVPAGEGRVLRKSVAEIALQQSNGLSKSAFIHLLKGLTVLSETALANYAPMLCRRIWRERPKILLSKSVNAALIDVLPQALKESSIEDVVKGLKQEPALAARALKARPELFGVPVLWAGKIGDEFAKVLGHIRQKKIKRDAILAAAKAARTDLALTVIETIGGELALDTLLADPASTELVEIGIWLAEAANQAQNPIMIIENRLLDEARPLSYKILLEISRLIRADERFDSEEHEPWCVAWTHAVGDLGNKIEKELLVYLFMRGLGHGTKFPADLLVQTFEGVFAAVSGKKLTSPLWSRLEQCLSWGSLWDSSNADRLVRTVAEEFVRKDFSPKNFMRLTEDIGIFKKLSEEAYKKYGGRRFLKRVEKELWKMPNSDREKLNVLKEII